MKKIKKKDKTKDKKTQPAIKTELPKNSNPQPENPKDTIGRRIYEYVMKD